MSKSTFDSHNMNDIKEAFLGKLTDDLFTRKKSSSGINWNKFNDNMKCFINTVIHASNPISEAYIQLNNYKVTLSSLETDNNVIDTKFKKYFNKIKTTKKRVPYDPHSMNNPTSHNIFSESNALTKSNSHIVIWKDYVKYMYIYWLDVVKKEDNN